MKRTLEYRIKKLEKKVAELASIDTNLRHYLNKRLPQRRAQQQASKRAVQYMQRLLKQLKRSRIRFTKTRKGKSQTLFSCTPNQAKKLRVFADTSLAVGHKWRLLKGPKTEENGQ